MLEENECYFIAITTSLDGYDLIIPFKFHTRDYDEAINLVKCITNRSPEKKLFITDDNGVFESVLRRKIR